MTVFSRPLKFLSFLNLLHGKFNLFWNMKRQYFLKESEYMTSSNIGNKSSSFPESSLRKYEMFNCDWKLSIFYFRSYGKDYESNLRNKKHYLS